MLSSMTLNPYVMLWLLDEGKIEEIRAELHELMVLYDLQREALAYAEPDLQERVRR